MRLGLPYAIAALILLGIGVWLDSEWLAVSGAVAAGYAAHFIRKAVIANE